MRVIVSLVVPAINQKYDISLPTEITVWDAVRMIGNALGDISDGKYVTSSEELLCLKGADKPLDYKNLIGYYNIENGDTLILV